MLSRFVTERDVPCHDEISATLFASLQVDFSRAAADGLSNLELDGQFEGCHP